MLDRHGRADYEGRRRLAQIPNGDLMLKIVDVIEAVNERIGRVVAWGVLVIVLIQFAVVIMRYVFGFGSIWVQEAITYIYASVFMGAAGYAFVRDGHVRVDIFYRDAGVKTKAVVDIVGTLLFLWPVTGLLTWVAYPYVARSFAILEGSRETAGLPFLFLLKAEILVFSLLLTLQGVALVLRSVATLTDRSDRPHRAVTMP